MVVVADTGSAFHFDHTGAAASAPVVHSHQAWVEESEGEASMTEAEASAVVEGAVVLPVGTTLAGWRNSLATTGCAVATFQLTASAWE